MADADVRFGVTSADVVPAAVQGKPLASLRVRDEGDDVWLYDVDSSVTIAEPDRPGGAVARRTSLLAHGAEDVVERVILLVDDHDVFDR